MSVRDTTPKTANPTVSPLVRLRRLLGRVRRAFEVERYDVFGRAVTLADRQFEPVPGYRFAWASPEDIEACDEHHTELDPRERREGVARLRFGHRAVIAFHGETAVFTMWVNPRNLNVPGHVKRALSEDQVFIYKAFTSPDHRGKKLYQAGMRFVLADLAREQKRQLVGYAHAKKRISRRGLAALGFQQLGRFTTWHAPGWQHTFLSRRLLTCFPDAVDQSGVLRGEALHQAQP